MRTGGARATLLAAVLALAGCPRPPLDFGPRGRIDDPSEAFAAVQARRAAVRAVSGEAKATLDTPQGSGSLTQFVDAEAPDRVRLVSVSFFGDPLAMLTSDGELFRLHDVERGKFYEGPATAANVSRLLPLRIEPEELVSLLLGVPPLLPAAAPSGLRVDDEARAYVLELSSDGDVQRVGLDTKTLRPLWTVLPGRGLLDAYRAEFADYGGQADLPDKVRLVSLDGRSRVALDWRERDLSPAFEPGTFRQEPPEGTAAETQ